MGWVAVAVVLRAVEKSLPVLQPEDECQTEADTAPLLLPGPHDLQALKHCHLLTPATPEHQAAQRARISRIRMKSLLVSVSEPHVPPTPLQSTAGAAQLSAGAKCII